VKKRKKKGRLTREDKDDDAGLDADRLI